MCYIRIRQDNTLLHAARMARADTVIVCSLLLAKNAMHSPTSNVYLLLSIRASDFSAGFISQRGDHQFTIGNVIVTEPFTAT